MGIHKKYTDYPHCKCGVRIRSSNKLETLCGMCRRKEKEYQKYLKEEEKLNKRRK